MFMKALGSKTSMADHRISMRKDFWTTYMFTDFRLRIVLKNPCLFSS